MSVFFNVDANTTSYHGRQPPRPSHSQGALTKVLHALSLNLATPLSMEIESVQPDPENPSTLRLRCRDPVLVTYHEVPCSMLVTSSIPINGIDTFKSFNDACLVYDGSLVVDAKFTTNDDSISAAGTAAKFSRSYDNGSLYLAHYNGREVGQEVARSVATKLRQAHGLATADQGPAKLPALRLGKVVGCRVPGGSQFLFAGCPRAFLDPSVSPPHGSRQIYSQDANSGYIQINMDTSMCVYSAIYLGTQPPPAYKLSALIGLSSTFLNPVLHDLKAKGSCDIMAWLDAPASQLLFHDGFNAVRHALLGRVAKAPNQHEAFSNVQGAVIEFLKHHAGELAGFSNAIAEPGTVA